VSRRRRGAAADAALAAQKRLEEIRSTLSASYKRGLAPNRSSSVYFSGRDFGKTSSRSSSPHRSDRSPSATTMLRHRGRDVPNLHQMPSIDDQAPFPSPPRAQQSRNPSFLRPKVPMRTPSKRSSTPSGDDGESQTAASSPVSMVHASVAPQQPRGRSAPKRSTSCAHTPADTQNGRSHSAVPKQAPCAQSQAPRGKYQTPKPLRRALRRTLIPRVVAHVSPMSSGSSSEVARGASVPPPTKKAAAQATRASPGARSTASWQPAAHAVTPEAPVATRSSRAAIAALKESMRARTRQRQEVAQVAQAEGVQAESARDAAALLADRALLETMDCERRHATQAIMSHLHTTLMEAERTLRSRQARQSPQASMSTPTSDPAAGSDACLQLNRSTQLDAPSAASSASVPLNAPPAHSQLPSSQVPLNAPPAQSQLPSSQGLIGRPIAALQGALTHRSGAAALQSHGACPDTLRCMLTAHHVVLSPVLAETPPVQQPHRHRRSSCRWQGAATAEYDCQLRTAQPGWAPGGCSLTGSCCARTGCILLHSSRMSQSRIVSRMLHRSAGGPA
jgi:hypothetical protein